MVTSRWFSTHAFHLAVIITLSSLLLFTNLHKGSLSGYDDALYAHEGKQMLTTGDWWTIRDNGVLNFEYPPLFVWLEALSMKMWGVSDFAAKFPAAVAGVLTIVATFCIARLWSKDFWLPVVAAWVLMLSQYFLKYSMHAMTDVPFTLLFTVSIYWYVKGPARPLNLLLCGFAIGLAILTRSILGFLPAAAIAGHWVWTRQRIAFRYALAGAVIAVLLPGVWYVSQYRMYGDEFLANHFAFISGKAVSSQPRDVWRILRSLTEYPWLLLRLYWPWLPFLIAGIVTSIVKATRQREKLSLLLVIWVIAVIGPLSLADAKVLRYILPVFPAFAILSAIPLARWISKVRNRRRTVFSYSLACLMVVIIAALASPRSRAEEMSTLAPIVDANTPPDERVLIYTHGEPRYDYVNQLLWYSNRFSEHLSDSAKLRDKLRSGQGRVFVVDKPSYREIVERTGVNVAILGRSEGFVCFRVV